MATGSTVLGLMDGLDKGVGELSYVVMPRLTMVNGNPNNIVTVQVGSDLAADIAGGSIFMGLGASGSTWIALGSAAA